MEGPYRFFFYSFDCNEPKHIHVQKENMVCKFGAVNLQEIKIKDVTVTNDTITANLVDGRTISVPLVWSWRLSEATPE